MPQGEFSSEKCVFGERLKALREKRGFIQAEIAATTGVSVDTVGRWESGKGFPTVEKLQPLAKKLDTSIAYLMGETELLSPTKVTIETDTRIIGDPYTPPDKPEEKVTNTPTHTVVEYARGNVKCSITLAPENATPENIDIAFRRVREAVEGKS